MDGRKERREGEGKGEGTSSKRQERDLGKGSPGLGGQSDIVRQEEGTKGGTGCLGGCWGQCMRRGLKGAGFGGMDLRKKKVIIDKLSVRDH